jgi:hypothetical protein
MRSFVTFVVFCSQSVCTGEDKPWLQRPGFSFRKEWAPHASLILEQKATKATKNIPIHCSSIVIRSRAAASARDRNALRDAFLRYLRCLLFTKCLQPTFDRHLTAARVPRIMRACFQKRRGGCTRDGVGHAHRGTRSRVRSMVRAASIAGNGRLLPDTVPGISQEI